MQALKVLCVIPALPNEVQHDTLMSVFNQTLPVTTTLILTEKVKENLAFPAKMSVVLNDMVRVVRLEEFDYLLRVDGDVILPPDFVKIHVDQSFDAVGCGYAQLIRISAFIEVMGGRFHPDHDDGYIIEKLAYVGKKSSWSYVVKPILKRASGLHHGSSWYLSQGELKYRYGDEPLELIGYLAKHYCPYSIFELVGFFKALLLNKKRFDVADRRLYKRLRKYREPKRFLKLPRFAIRVMKGYNFE